MFKRVPLYTILEYVKYCVMKNSITFLNSIFKRKKYIFRWLITKIEFEDLHSFLAMILMKWTMGTWGMSSQTTCRASRKRCKFIEGFGSISTLLYPSYLRWDNMNIDVLTSPWTNGIAKVFHNFFNATLGIQCLVQTITFLIWAVFPSIANSKLRPSPLRRLTFLRLLNNTTFSKFRRLLGIFVLLISVSTNLNEIPKTKKKIISKHKKSY